MEIDVNLIIEKLLQELQALKMENIILKIQVDKLTVEDKPEKPSEKK